MLVGGDDKVSIEIFDGIVTQRDMWSLLGLDGLNAVEADGGGGDQAAESKKIFPHRDSKEQGVHNIMSSTAVNHGRRLRTAKR